MKKVNQKIIIATGGTGGHIFPSLSLANFLKKNYKIEIITDKRGSKYIYNNENIDLNIINSGTIFSKNIFKIFTGFIKVIYSFFVSIFLLIKKRPKLIIGMGGYSSFPLCLAGYILKVPIIIYENNLFIGRANKFLLPLAKKILVSTDSIQGIKPKYKEKVLYVGYLIRKNILSLQQNRIENIEKIKKNLSILIMGGSQSAKIFGEILPNILIKCFENKIKFKIYQQCLENQIENIKKIYSKFELEYELFSFSSDMTKYYKKTDLAITRSGASSLAELTNLRIPFIAVPLPTSIDDHQFKNASYFKNKGYCFLLEERFLSDKLFEILKDLNNDAKKLLLMKEKMTEHTDKYTFDKIQRIIGNILT